MEKRETQSFKNIPIIQVLNMKCGECLHFKKLPKGEAPCSSQGVRQFASAPSQCFQPDYSQLIKNTDQFAIFASLLESFSPKQIKLAVAILLNAHETKVKKFPFGSKVYIKVGDDYIGNYLSAYVLGYTNNGQAVISGSPLSSSRGKNFLGFVDVNSCLSFKDWEIKKKQLIAGGRIYDPKAMNKKILTSIDNYEPEIPTLDNAPKEWKEKKKVKDIYDKITQSYSV